MLSLQRFARGLSSHFLIRWSSSTAAAAVTATAKLSSDSSDNAKKDRKSLVAAAFESLKDDKNAEEQVKSDQKASKPNIIEQKQSISEKIENAKTVNNLLTLAENNGPITRADALKMVSILSEWSTQKRIKVSDFENDPRFLKICRLLGRSISKTDKSNSVTKKNQVSKYKFGTDDLNTVLGIAGDDEAAKLISSITIPQMIKVMSSLAQRKRRSTPLLRSLAFNISSSSDQLDLKQCGDILYAMATLNFPDSVLTAKVCADILAVAPKHTEKSAVIGSILTSLSLLKYRDLDVLEVLTNWILQNINICRPQDITSLILTLGTLNYKSANSDELKTKLHSSLNEKEFTKKIDLLNYVWALTLCRLVDDNYINKILCTKFIEELQKEAGDDGLTPNAKMKLLNINAYAKLLQNNYKGSLLNPTSEVFSVSISHSKSKQILFNGMLDALKSLFPSDTYFKSLVDSKMGFLIDSVCALDSKRNPLPLDKQQKDAIKVAVMVIDFHDTCHGPHRSVTGLTNLCFDLLEKSGYKVLPVLYNEFSTSDKLLKRVQYLEASLKNIVKFNSN